MDTTGRETPMGSMPDRLPQRNPHVQRYQLDDAHR
jgi:hypothetical protein